MSRKRPKLNEEDENSLDNKKIEEKEQEREEYDAFSFMKNKKQTAAVAGVFFAVGFLISWFASPPMTAQIIGTESLVDIDDVGQDTIDYINTNLLRDGFTAALREITEKEGMFEASVDVIQDGQETGQNVKFYISGSGQLLFFNEPVDMTVAIEPPPETQDTGVPKSDKPVVNVFVMSYCPYGLQMEKAMIPVMELLGGVADINLDYVQYLMHGEREMVQNNYQHCIEKDQPDKFVEYLTCFVQSDDHAKCMTEAGVDSAGLDSCLADLEDEFDVTNVFKSSEERYPPYPVDAVLAAQYGVGGSPTLVINGQTVQVNRSPEAIKQAICSAFNTQPEECSTVLSSEGAAAGIGPLSGGNSDSTAQC